MANTVRLDVRISESERQHLKRAARYFNTTQSEMLRALINLPIAKIDTALAANSGEELYVLVFDTKTLKELVSQIRYYGYHYDQGIHALNTIAKKGFLKDKNNRDFWERACEKLESVNAATEQLMATAESIVEKANDITKLDEKGTQDGLSRK